MNIYDYEDRDHGIAQSIGECTWEDERIYNIDNCKFINAVINYCSYTEPYFKYIKTDRQNREIYVARISMITSKYIDTEYEDYKLSDQEIDELIDILHNKFTLAAECGAGDTIKRNPEYSSVIDSYTKREVPVWKAIIFKMNNIFMIDKLNNCNEAQWFNPISYDLPIPDYSLLKEVRNHNV